MKIDLNPTQQLTFTKFLDHELQVKPTNWEEWGHEWMLLKNIKSSIDQKLMGGALKVKSLEFWAIFNFLSNRCDEIIQEQSGEQEFDAHLRLFITFHNASQSRLPVSVFCSESYFIRQGKTIFEIDPTLDPEIVLPDPEKYAVRFYTTKSIQTDVPKKD
jgi:hypothetical protein